MLRALMWLAKGGRPHGPSSTRRTFSTSARVAAETVPHGALPSRSLLMVRSWSQRITLGVFTPLGRVNSDVGRDVLRLRPFEVSGTVITSPASPALKASSLTISTGGWDS